MSFLLLVLKTYHKLTLHLEMFNSHRNQVILVVIQLSGFCIIWVLVNKGIKDNKILS